MASDFGGFLGFDVDFVYHFYNRFINRYTSVLASRTFLWIQTANTDPSEFKIKIIYGIGMVCVLTWSKIFIAFSPGRLKT
jgi:hypothetical protein